MKKIFTLCVAVLSAMSMFAEVQNMTVEQAVAATQMLQSGATGTDSVAVTGYITKTDEKISRGQQTFWMDDEQGGRENFFEGYWCNLPQDLVDANDPLHVGDKVTIVGLLTNYNNSVMEMKNGTVIVLEHQVIVPDTINMGVCEAIEEGNSMNAGAYSDYIARVEGVIARLTNTSTANNTQTFYLACEDGTELQGYNATIIGDFAEEGDKVQLWGKLTKYVNAAGAANIEIVGSATVIEKGNLVIEAIPATVAEAVELGRALANNAYSEATYAVTGYVDSIAYTFSETNKNMSFYMCDDLANPTYEFEAYRAQTEVDIPVGARVTITGKLQHYYKAATETTAEVDLIEISNGVATIVTGIDNTVITLPVEKFILNGNVYIRKDGVIYNVQGAVVK